MSKVVTIPDYTRPNWVCCINGVRYAYPAGSTQEVPDEVADLIEDQMEQVPVPDPVPEPVQPGGGVSSWNDLTDKPFYEETTPGIKLEWDGNREGHEFFEMDGAGFVKLSDEVFSEDAVDPKAEWSFTYMTSDGAVVYNKDNVYGGLRSDFVPEMKTGQFYIEAPGDVVITIAMIFGEDTDMGGMVFTKGTWTSFDTNSYVSNVNLPGSTVIHKLDEKYLPEHLQFGESDNAVLLPETQFLGGLMDRVLVAFGASVELVEGCTYTINWNGVDYEAVCYMAQTSFAENMVPVVGNPLPQGGADNGLPFVIGGNEQGLAAWPLDGSTNAIVSIKGYRIEPIPVKYLPKVSDLDATWLADLKTALGLSS